MVHPCRLFRRLAPLILTLLAQPGAVRACDLALLLAVDVSGSVDPAEYRIQIEGSAAGLLDPEVADTLIRRHSAVAVVQWSGAGRQVVTLPWQQMTSRADLADFVTALRASPRAFVRSDTAVADAIRFALDQMAGAPAGCRRRVIDISGDGPQNAGTALPAARQAAIAAHVTLNAVAIESIGLSVTEFYRRHVITPAGFVITSPGFSTYPATIRAKLIREVARPMG